MIDAIKKFKHHYPASSLSSSYSEPLWYVEQAIDFTTELAFSIARSPRGNICVLPVVETYQENYQCSWVKGPYYCSNPSMLDYAQIDKHIIKNVTTNHPHHRKLSSVIKKSISMLHRLNYVGIIAFELFLTKDDQILINELAPRVHNSAHYSLEALNYSQFDVHVHAISDFNLPECPSILTGGFAMVNLIGSNKEKTQTETENNDCKLLTSSDTHLCWYGKKINKPNRKLGHINSVARNSDDALKKLTNQLKKLYPSESR